MSDSGVAPQPPSSPERQYTVTQTITTVRVCSYTHAEVCALLEAHRGRDAHGGDDDLGEALHAAILDASDITDRVVAEAEQLSCTAEFDVQISRDEPPRFDHHPMGEGPLAR